MAKNPVVRFSIYLLLSIFVWPTISFAANEATELEGLSAKEPLQRQAARDKIVKERHKTIKELLAIAKMQPNEPFKLGDSRLKAISLLAEYRAETENVLDFLIKYIDKLPPGKKNSKPQDYPCVKALCKIGRPATELILAKLSMTDVYTVLTMDDKQKIELMAYVVLQIEGEEIGEYMLEKRMYKSRVKRVKEYWVKRAEARRLKLYKAGKGLKVAAVGARDCRKLMDSLAVEYVMAKAVIQMKYSGLDERSAVGRFATDVAKAVAGEKVSAGSPQLLLLDGPMSEKTSDANREKFEAAKPERHVLAACSVAVIVNPKNPLKSITAEQLIAVFKGKTKSWTNLAPEFKADKLDITCYSPIPPKDAAVKYFHRDILHAARRTNVRYCKTADSVVGFVASTPGGIGVIDVNDLALPSAQAGVKVLAIGSAGAAMTPIAENLFAGKYPLCQQVILYVSPKAGEETKDFVKFILSGACDETFSKAGLVTAHSQIAMPKPKQEEKKAGKPGKGKNAKLPKWEKTEPVPQDPGGW